MKRFCTLLFFIVAITASLHSAAQVNYAFSASSGTYTAITGTIPPLLSLGRSATDDGVADAIPIGFSFNYNGTVYTTLGVSTNGFLILGTNALNNAGAQNDLTSGPGGSVILRPVIAPLWDDLDIQSVGNLQYQVSGTAPNRVFTMQWTNVKWIYVASGGSISFQAKLFEGSNNIQFVYQQEANVVTGGSASIGITAAATGPGNFISLQNTSAAPSVSRTTDAANLFIKPATGQVYTFIPGVILNDIAVTSVYTLAKIPTISGNSNVVSTLITNTSANPITNFSVSLTVTGVTNFTNTKTISSLAPGTSALITFDGYTSTVTGNNLVSVSVPADSDNSNNTSAITQTVTTDRWGYAFAATSNNGFGFGAAGGDLATKFRNAGTTLINQVTVYFSGAGGQPYEATIWDANGTGGGPGTLLWSSPTATSVSGRVDIAVAPNVSVIGDFFVGVRQLGTANIAVGFENENPIRPSTFYSRGTGTTNWFVIGSRFRLMMEAQFVSSLPVTTTALRGERKDSKNILSWTTLTEQNNKGFYVQRSADGSNFSSLGFVQSRAVNGNSTVNIDYQFYDAKPLLSNGYYRLMQKDNDDKVTYSNTVLIKGLKAREITLQVYPNPVRSNLNMVITTPETNTFILYITDVWGRKMMQKSAQLINGDNTMSLNVAHLASGSYTIKAVSTNGRQNIVTKFVKE